MRNALLSVLLCSVACTTPSRQVPVVERPVLRLPTLFGWLALMACSAPTTDPVQHTERSVVGGPCDGCELLFAGMPDATAIGPSLTLTTASDPGAPLVVEGRVIQVDGRTPAAGTILYLYHTNAEGLYAPAADQPHTRRHGKLRGWVRTDAEGRFTFISIRPAPYPNEQIPAHIHVFVKEPDKDVHYLDEVRFLDDPLLTPEVRARNEGRGGDLDIALRRDASGTWRGRLAIVLGRNIPGYP
jgi:protocatechuate 3,4-dioxygenase, beta subunit